MDVSKMHPNQANKRYIDNIIIVYLNVYIGYLYLNDHMFAIWGNYAF